MKKEQLEQEKKSLQEAIHNAQQHLKELEAMTPDEDKLVVMTWYTVCVSNWVAYIDQWLDATDVSHASTFCMSKYNTDDIIDYIAFQAPIWWLEIKQESSPF